MGDFDSVDDVEIPKPAAGEYKKEPYLGDGGNGDYVVELLHANKYQVTTGKNAGNRYVGARLRLISVPAGSTYKPGDIVQHSVALQSKFKGSWQKDLKFFVGAFFGIPAADVDGAGCDLFVSDAQPAKGRKARATVEKKPGKAFANTKWRAA